MSAAIDLAAERFRHDVVRLHRLGPRALHEALVELAARRLIRTEIEILVGKYARLDPATLDAAGARDWPGS